MQRARRESILSEKAYLQKLLGGKEFHVSKVTKDKEDEIGCYKIDTQGTHFEVWILFQVWKQSFVV